MLKPLSFFVAALGLLDITQLGSTTDKKAPNIDQTVSNNVTVQLGKTAYLPCKVHNLGNESVSWIRQRDSHILTVNDNVFIASRRFQSLFHTDSKTWTLQIKYIEENDAGCYECQVSTVPKINRLFHLAVIIPSVSIYGNRDVHVQSGSQVQIRCVVSEVIEVPGYIQWFHNNKLVVPFEPRISYFSEPLFVNSSLKTISTLVIKDVIKQDEGNYLCKPANLRAATFRLHVINAELSEPSIQSANDSSSIVLRSDKFQLLFITFMFNVRATWSFIYRCIKL